MTFEDVKRIRENPQSEDVNNSELHRLIDLAIERQIPKGPYLDNENGIYGKEYCPTCHRSLFPHEHHCRCGQALKWENY